jgi:hypothetical protein
MTLADDPHLVERIARMAVFHGLPAPVVVQMTLMASELQRRPANLVHREIEQRIAALRAAEGEQRPTLRVLAGGKDARRR